MTTYHRILFLLLSLSLVALTMSSCAKKEEPAPTMADSTQTPVQRGAFLVQVGGCADCHASTHPGPGMIPGMPSGLSGHPASLKLGAPPKLENGWGWAGSMTQTAFAGPWGISYAVNLTPDSATGIGSWQAHNFIEAMRTGQFVANGHLTGRMIMPPMPWPTLQHMSDDDLTAIFDYLHSQPAVSNKVPDYTPPGGGGMGAPPPGMPGGPPPGAMPPAGMPPGGAPAKKH